jgi:hypothetical protein
MTNVEARYWWCPGSDDDIAYHDEERGRPVVDDRVVAVPGCHGVEPHAGRPVEFGRLRCRGQDLAEAVRTHGRAGSGWPRRGFPCPLNPFPDQICSDYACRDGCSGASCTC